jgi:hypothetical protein
MQEGDCLSRESLETVLAFVDCPRKLRMLRQVLGSSNILALLSAIPIILAAGDTGGLEYGALSGHGSHIEGSVPAVSFRGNWSRGGQLGWPVHLPLMVLLGKSYAGRRTETECSI